MESAFTEYGEKYKEYPVTHIRFNGYKIRGMDRVVKMAIECHKRTLHLKMISWDFSIDAIERVVLIESNQCGQSVWLPQIAHGQSIFGKNTIKMLRSIK